MRMIQSRIRRKRWIDILLTILLLLQMAYMLVGERLHEWLGVLMILLFLLHIYENRGWITHIAKGKYTLFRTLQTIVNGMLLLCMLSLIFSGILLSRHVFSFLDIQSHMQFARNLHMLAAYWGFVCMGVHIGFHWRMLSSIRVVPKRKRRVLIACYIGILLYGIYCCIDQELYSYLFFTKQFAFFDLSVSLFQFLLSYFAILIVFASIPFLLQHIRSHKK